MFDLRHNASGIAGELGKECKDRARLGGAIVGRNDIHRLSTSVLGLMMFSWLPQPPLLPDFVP